MLKEGENAYTTESRNGELHRVLKWKVGPNIQPFGFKLICEDGVESFSSLTSTYNKEGIERIIEAEISKLENKIALLKLIKKTQL